MYPVHVAIIMDGNGRWAKKIGLPRMAGHKAGVKRLHSIVKLSIEYNIKYLTLYAFSSENWSRPKTEIDDLMYLLSSFLDKEAKELLKQNIILKVSYKNRFYFKGVQTIHSTPYQAQEIYRENKHGNS